MAVTCEELHIETPISTWRSVAARNNALYWEWCPERMGQPVQRWNNVWAADPGSLNVFPNSATAIREIDEAEVAELVSRLQGFYAQRAGARWLLWSAWKMPDLSSHGMQKAGDPPLMIRWPWQATDRPRPCELTICEVTDSEHLTDWLHVLINGYPAPELGLPGRPPFYDARVLGSPFRLFIGYVNGEPVSCSASYTDERVNGLFAIATLPNARGRGYGAALTDAAVADLSKPAVLTASEFGYGVYRSLGFEEIFRFEIWSGLRNHSPSIR